MRAQDVTDNGARLALWRQNHDHPPAGPHVFHMVHQMLVLFDGTCSTNQFSLQPLEYSMLYSFRVETTQVFLSVEHVDRLPIEASFHQCINGGLGVLRVGDGATTRLVGYGMKPRSLGLVSMSQSIWAAVAAINPRTFQMSQLRPQEVDTFMSVRPATMSTAARTLAALTDSPRTTTPTTKAPTAPIPVQTV